MRTAEELSDYFSLYAPGWLPGWLGSYLASHPIISIAIVLAAVVLGLVAMVATDRLQGSANQWFDERGFAPALGKRITRVATYPLVVPLSALLGFFVAAYLNASALFAIVSAMATPLLVVAGAVLLPRVFRLEDTTLTREQEEDDFESIRELIEAKTASPSSRLPPEEAFANAKAIFERRMAASLRGDPQARKKLAVAFTNADGIARQLWGSTGKYYEFHNPAIEQLRALDPAGTDLLPAQQLPSPSLPIEIEAPQCPYSEATVAIRNAGTMPLSLTAIARLLTCTQENRGMNRSPFRMRWVGSDEATCFLAPGHIGKVALAIAEPVIVAPRQKPYELHEVRFWEAGRTERPFEWWRWNSDDNERLRITLTVEIVSDPPLPHRVILPYAITAKPYGGLIIEQTGPQQAA